MAVVIVILIILLILYFYSKSHSFSMQENIKQSTNFFLIKLIVFFFIIGSLTKIVSVTTEVGFLSFISTGSYVLAGLCFSEFSLYTIHEAMILESKVGRNARQCVTCQYWTGQSARADSPNFIVCDLKERAICNKTGVKKATWQSCSNHEKRHNL